MKFVRFTVAGERNVRAAVATDKGYEEIEGDLFGGWTRTGKLFDPAEVRLEAPLVPRHIIGIGKNFVPEGTPVPEAPELPIFFFKPLTTVIGPEAQIVLPGPHYEGKYESELAVIIGKEARSIGEDEALDYVFGYTVANDLADMSYFHPEGHWTIGKSFDTFCPLGPHIETELDLDRVRIRSYVNGEKTQDSGLELMITSITRQIAFLSGCMTLQPGDVILTGTPAGALTVKDGDVVVCEVEGLGELRNPVVKGA